MILTEEEARTKRCQESFGQFFCTPDGRMHMAAAVTAGAGFALQASPSYCIGSECMAWRWQHGEPDTEDDEVGYCGKAGRPSP